MEALLARIEFANDPYLETNLGLDNPKPMHFAARPRRDRRVVAEREKKGSQVGEGGAHMELENRPKPSKRSRKIFAFLMETRFELARFPTADVEVSSKHPSRGTQGFLNTAP